MSNGAYWIRLRTDIWDNNDAVKLIDAMPDADSILVIWFKLLTHAGKSNADGQLLINGFIPLEPDMLPDLIRRPQEKVDRALSILKRFGLIETENGIEVANWFEYVNADAMAELRAKNAARVAKHRAKKKSCNITSNITGNGECNDQKKEEIRIKKERKIDIVPSQTDDIPFAEILGYLTELTGKVFKPTSKANRKWISARWNDGYRLDAFKRVIDNKVETWGKPPRPGKEDMRPYLRPETLFGNKFEGYLNERPPNGGGDGGGPSGGGNGGNKASADLEQFVIS